MKPSCSSSADLGNLDGSGSGGPSGSILYTYWGRGDGAGILVLANVVSLGQAKILATGVGFKKAAVAFVESVSARQVTEYDNGQFVGP